MHPTVLFLCGLPGTGKSTLARILSKKLHWGLISQDYFLFELNGVRDPELGAGILDYTLCQQLMLDTMRTFLSHGKSVIIEGSLVSISEEDSFSLAPYVSAAQLLDAHLSYVRLTASVETRRMRMHKRGYIVPQDIDARLSRAQSQLDPFPFQSLSTEEISPELLYAQISSSLV